jgi:hypothetical protein
MYISWKYIISDDWNNFFPGLKHCSGIYPGCCLDVQVTVYKESRLGVLRMVAYSDGRSARDVIDRCHLARVTVTSRSK